MDIWVLWDFVRKILTKDKQMGWLIEKKLKIHLDGTDGG